MKVTLKRSALAVLAAVVAAGVMPEDQLMPSAWAETYLHVPDGPKAGSLWDASLTPYIREPLDMMATDSGVNEVAVRKSAQTGFTIMIIAAAGHMIDTEPCRAMIVQPTTGALSDFNKDKLSVSIDTSPVLKRKVKPQTSRDGDASTTTSKRYAGGSLTLAIANSAADLRSKTIKKAYLDEVDEYPDDLDGQGDPLAMIEARQESFLMSGEWLRAYVSTPTVKGASKIDDLFEAGDQRFWCMPCPGCGEDFRFVFDRKQFRFNDAYPYEAHYVTPCCGSIVEAHEKVSLMRKGHWVPFASRPGAFPSYHFDALSSPFVPWDKIASRFLSANGDPLKLKAFHNLTLGLAYEMKGDAPDHVRLMERRSETFKRGHIPAQGLILTGAADVQGSGIWYSIRAYGADRQSYVVDADFIAGDTDDPHAGAFLKLEEIRTKRWPDAFGKTREVDLFAVDSGFRAHVVYTWVRGKMRTFAVKGLDGWSRPALGQPSKVDIDFRGERVRGGAMVWGVGTWSLKGAFYADLRKEGMAAGQPVDPPGYIHFGTWMDEVYFRQITSEYLGTVKVKGRMKRQWVPRAGEENHLLDCEVYNNALADYLGVSRMTPQEWSRLAALRGVPDSVSSPDLFAPEPLIASAPIKQSSDDQVAIVEIISDRHDDDGSVDWFDSSSSFWDE